LRSDIAYKAITQPALLAMKMQGFRPSTNEPSYHAIVTQSILKTLAVNRRLTTFLHDLEEAIMLVAFTCPAYADITMFGDVAVRLLKMMGHSGTVPSALAAEDVLAALARLVAAVEAEKSSPQPPASEARDEDEPPVTLPHRALPLIELLKAAAKDECAVMWGTST